MCYDIVLDIPSTPSVSLQCAHETIRRRDKPVRELLVFFIIYCIYFNIYTILVLVGPVFFCCHCTLAFVTRADMDKTS